MAAWADHNTITPSSPQMPNNVKIESSLKSEMACGKPAKDLFHLKGHLESVHGKVSHKSVHERIRFKCEQCKYSTVHQGHINRHIRIGHNKELSCQHCHYKTSNGQHFRRHFKAVHEGIKNFTCQKCNFSAARAEAVKRHIKSIHLKIRDFKCDHCAYESSTRGHLKIHMNSSHLKVFDHQCDQCGYETVRRCHLIRHKNRVHKNSVLSVMKHEIKEDPETEDTIQRKCELCEFRAFDEDSITKHLISCHVVSG